MNTDTFELKEIQDVALKAVKDNPVVTVFVVVAIAGISKGIADGFSRLAPTIEKGWKYAVDKAVGCLPKPATQSIWTDESIIDTSVNSQQAEAITV